ncbi:MAG: glycoside hydrolase domain-containing protein, partial [Armatimonadota bacterium]
GENRSNDYPTHRLMGLMLAHDCGPWPIWSKSQVVFDAWTTADQFGIQTAKFLPYWKPNGVTVEGTDAVVSVYQQPGKALLIVLNTTMTEQTVKVTVNAKALGLREGYHAAMPGCEAESLRVGKDGFAVKVPARDYQMVVVQ